MTFSPYAEYKFTGRNWLNKIPLHWKLLRNKYFLQEVNARSTTGEEVLLTVSQYTGVTPRKTKIDENQKNLTNAISLVGYKLVWSKDIVMNIMLAWNGSLGVSKFNGIVSPAYCIYRSQKDVNSEYLHYLYRIPIFTGLFKTLSTGVVDSRLRLYPDVFFRLETCLPSLGEQESIVRFLDYKCGQINKFIQKKKRLIKLLKEQKQAIIDQAIIRGLNPNVRLKPSGIDLLGDIPEHWEVRKIGQLCKFNPSKSEATSLLLKDGMVRFLAMENITTEGNLINPQLKHISEVDSGFTYFKNGDVVIAKITPCFENGKGALIENLDSICGFGTTELIVLRPFQVVEGSFLYWITRSSAFRLIGEKFMVGAAGQKRVQSSFIKGYSIAFPPVDEQNSIINYIQTITTNINNCISRIYNEIQLIQEYRTRLISDVVTGQIDVRNVEIGDIVEEEFIEEALEEGHEEAPLELVGASDDD